MTPLLQVEIGRPTPLLFAPEALPSSAPTMTFAMRGGVSASVALAAAVQREGVPVPSVAVVVVGSSSVGPDPGAAVDDEVPDASLLGGIIGDHAGQAWLDLGGRGAWPVSITGVTAAGVVSFARFAGKLPMGATGRLHFNAWAGTLAAGALGASVERVGVWRVEYIAERGGAFAGEARTEEGQCRLVRTPFRTGLGLPGLTQRVPHLALRTPAGQTSWGPQVEAAHVELVHYIEERLEAGDRGRYADQLQGATFRDAHAALVYLRAVESGYISGVDVDDVRASFFEALSRALRRKAWVDTDDDGVIDDGEGGDTAAAAWVPGTGVSSHAPDVAAAYASGARTRPTLDIQDR